MCDILNGPHPCSLNNSFECLIPNDNPKDDWNFLKISSFHSNGSLQLLNPFLDPYSLSPSPLCLHPSPFLLSLSLSLSVSSLSLLSPSLSPSLHCGWTATRAMTDQRGETGGTVSLRGTRGVSLKRCPDTLHILHSFILQRGPQPKRYGRGTGRGTASVEVHPTSGHPEA